MPGSWESENRKKWKKRQRLGSACEQRYLGLALFGSFQSRESGRYNIEPPPITLNTLGKRDEVLQRKLRAVLQKRTWGWT